MNNIKLEDLTKDQLIEYINGLSLELEGAKLIIQRYEEQFRLYQHQKYGSKKETINPSQLSLFNETERESDLSIEEPELVEKNEVETKTTKKPRKEKR